MELKNTQQQAKKTTKTSKIFLGGLPQDSNVEELQEMLSKLTASSFNIEIKCRKNRKKCLGSGVIRTGEAEAKKLIEKGSLLYKGRKVKILPYREGKELLKFREQLQRRRIFVKNMPEDVRVETITRYFLRYGPLESVYLRGEPSSNLKIAVVIFVEKHSARKTYQDFRFGRINFKKILNSKKMKKKIQVAFCFSDFKLKKSALYKRNLSKKNYFEKNNLMKALGAIKNPGESGDKILSISRPGTKGFCYKTDTERQYQFRFGMRKRMEVGFNNRNYSANGW